MQVEFDFDHWRELFLADPDAFERERARLNDELCGHWKTRCLVPERIDLARKALDGCLTERQDALVTVQQLLGLMRDSFEVLTLAMEELPSRTGGWR